MLRNLPRTSFVPTLWTIAATLLPAAAHAGRFDSVRTYRTVEVAKGVYAFVTPEERTGFQPGNSIAILGDDGVLVVDSGNIPSATRRQIAEIRRLTPKPVRYLVNTHWHPDHHLGNAEYRAAFPAITIISTPETRANMIARFPVYLGQMKSFAPTDTMLRKALAAGKTSKGVALTEEQQVMWKLAVNDYAEFYPEVSHAKLEAPNLVFEDSLTVTLGKRVVKLVHPGRGNTAGDAYVYVPDVNTLITGDLVTLPCPFAFGSFLGDWVRALDQMKALHAEVIVPGHGDIQHDYDYIDRVRELLVFTRAKVGAAVEQGLSLEDTRKRVDLSEFKQRFSGGDVVRAQGFDSWFAGVGVERAYEEARYFSEGPVPAQK
jgi:cyclase